MPETMQVTTDFSTDPYWWRGTSLAADAGDTLPAKADIVIVGSGFTGASAALEAARSGRSVVVVDAGSLGFGASSRNFGYLTGGLGKSRLARRHPGQKGEDISRAYPEAADHVLNLLEREEIDAGLRHEGLSILAHSPEAFTAIKAQAEQDFNVERGVKVFSAEQLSAEMIASERFYGGVFNPTAIAVQPGQYVAGIIAAARRYGARFVPFCEALELKGQAGNWTIVTSKGEIRAGKIGLGTDGHSGKLFPFLRRRIVPVVGTVIATEELPADVMKRIFPRLTWFSDTQFGFLCFRPSPDHRRVIFAKAGLPGSFNRDAKPYAARVYKEMVKTVPELAQFRVAHAWAASVGVTFDGVPHLGIKDGVHYAAGYNGSGVAMASYLGYWMGRRLVGDMDHQLVFENETFPTNILYTGNTWFMPGLRVLLNALKLQV